MAHYLGASTRARTRRWLRLSIVGVMLTSAACASTLRGSSSPLPTPDSQSQLTSQASLVSDGCTWFPEGSWHACCVQHDERYFIGGSFRQKLAADRGLASCVSRAGHPLVGSLMFLGTQLGGLPWLPTPFRWGFGEGKPLQSADTAVTGTTATAPAASVATTTSPAE